MRIHIAIGLTPDGDYTSLYLGDDAEEAVASIKEAGSKKKIVQGLHLSNPHSLPHKRFNFPENAGEEQAVEAFSHAVQPKPAKKAAKSAKKAAKSAPPKDEEAPAQSTPEADSDGDDTSDDDPFATKKTARKSGK